MQTITRNILICQDDGCMKNFFIVLLQLLNHRVVFTDSANWETWFTERRYILTKSSGIISYIANNKFHSKQLHKFTVISSFRAWIYIFSFSHRVKMYLKLAIQMGLICWFGFLKFAKSIPDWGAMQDSVSNLAFARWSAHTWGKRFKLENNLSLLLQKALLSRVLINQTPKRRLSNVLWKIEISKGAGCRLIRRAFRLISSRDAIHSSKWS